MVSFEYLYFISKVTIFMTVASNITTPIEGQHFNITEGSTRSITCTATGYPVPTVIWQNNDGSSLSNNRLMSGSPVDMRTGVGNVTSVSVELMVIGAMRVDTGMYRCSANNSVSNTTRNISITVQCKLIVVYMVRTCSCDVCVDINYSIVTDNMTNHDFSNVQIMVHL